MWRRKKKILLKVTLTSIVFWLVCMLIFKIQASPEHEEKRNLHQEVVDFMMMPTEFKPFIKHLLPADIGLRDAELQRKFSEGQELLKAAQQHKTFNKASIEQPSNIEGFDQLDKETKSLISSGLIVPKWILNNQEVPEFPDAPGELGKEYNVDVSKLTSLEKIEFDKAWGANAFNGYASDRISLHRSLQDVRDSLCQKEDYSGIFIDTSVIIIFHNEDWNVLLRTVHSVFDRSPPRLVKEIILVDDFSDKHHLKEKLEEYMGQFSKVKILRAAKRQGLIRARLMGAAKAKGDVLTFLDSHCECTKGWLEPLLMRIQQNESNVVTPVIDVIDDTTFRYMFGPASSTNLGGFDWSLQFTWHAIPQQILKERKSAIEPLKSPTMAGGLFSISRRYFEHVGAYDPGMEIWGGENLELSFRVWMCGGALEIIQCSHVGHVFRKRSPYKWTVADAVRRNSVRTALVWMDDYKKYYFDKTSHNLGNYGDIAERVKLRNDLQCKSFRWYLENIYPDQFVPGNALALGTIKSKLSKSTEGVCIEAAFHKPTDDVLVKLTPCSLNRASQIWYLTQKKEIYVDSNDGACLDFANTGVKTYPCHGMRGNQEWKYGSNHMIIHVITELCLEISDNLAELFMKPCIGSDNQIWYWKTNTPTS